MFTDNVSEMSGVDGFGRIKIGKFLKRAVGIKVKDKKKKKKVAAAKIAEQKRQAEIAARTEALKQRLERKVKAVEVKREPVPFGRKLLGLRRKKAKMMEREMRAKEIAAARRLQIMPTERALVTPVSVPPIAPPVKIAPPPPIPLVSEETFAPAPAGEELVPFMPQAPAPSAQRPVGRTWAEEEPEGEWVEEEEAPMEEEFMEEEMPWGEGDSEEVLEGLYFVEDNNDTEFIAQGAKFVNAQPRLKDSINRSKEVMISARKRTRRPELYSTMNKTRGKLGIDGVGYLPTFNQQGRIVESYGPASKTRNEFGFLEGSLSDFGKKGRKTLAVGLTAIAALVGYGLYKRYQDKKAAALKAEQDAIALQKAGDVQGASSAKMLASRYNLEAKQLETQMAQKANVTPSDIQATLPEALQPSFFEQYKIPLLLAGVLSVGMYLYKRG